MCYLLLAGSYIKQRRKMEEHTQGNTDFFKKMEQGYAWVIRGKQVIGVIERMA
jgi:hypothetical protein